jgi:hypothetical protein
MRQSKSLLSTVVIGACDRALGRKARVNSRWCPDAPRSRVFSHQNRMRMSQSPGRVVTNALIGLRYHLSLNRTPARQEA